MQNTSMERIKKFLILIIVFSLVMMVAGCGKKYTDYENVWVSDDGKIKIWPTGIVTIDYPEINPDLEIQSLSDSGKTHFYFVYNINHEFDFANLIWEADMTIKKDIMYLEIIDDRCTGLEGKTVILRQSEE